MASTIFHIQRAASLDSKNDRSYNIKYLLLSKISRTSLGRRLIFTFSNLFIFLDMLGLLMHYLKVSNSPFRYLVNC